MRIQELIEARKRRRRYSGPPLETGGTSIKGNEAPAVRTIAKLFPPNASVVDWGAGKHGRNAIFLRNNGFKVYSYDPFNGQSGADGWTQVTKDIPKGIGFNVGFSSFVLNVVPEYLEKEIIRDVAAVSKKQYHITRNMDVYVLVEKNLLAGNPKLVEFFNKEFATPAERKALQTGQLPEESIMEFCQFGVPTTAGFQRIPTSEDLGLRLIKSTTGYKIYES